MIMMMRSRTALLATVALVCAACPADAASLALGDRLEISHAARGHEVHLSGAAITTTRDGTPVVSWIAPEGHVHHLWVARPGAPDGAAVRVNPDGLTVDSAHQPPALARGREGEVYVTWSSSKAKPEGTFFASDLQLSRSLDGGRIFEPPLRVNDDRPVSHSFEGVTVTRDGTVVVAWIDSRDGPDREGKAGTFVARVADRGRRVEGVVKVDGATCVCCRVDAATGPGDTVALTWRRVFPGSIRDMVLAVSRDGGRSFGDAALVHADRWQIAACPHRGGAVGIDGTGRTYLAWYTEGKTSRPAVLFASSADGRRFSAPRSLQTSQGAIPDHVRMAVDDAGRVVVAWEESTAVRRRVMVRWSADGGRTFSGAQSLSRAIKARAPALTVAGRGEFLIACH